MLWLSAEGLITLYFTILQFIIFFHAAPGVSKCYPNPCLFDGECVEKDGSYFCKCKKHFTGTHCQSRGICLIYAPKPLPLKKRYLLSPLVSTITSQNPYALSPLVSTITSEKSLSTITSCIVCYLSKIVVPFHLSYPLLPLKNRHLRTTLCSCT